jgi:hypothetical protein
VRVTVEDGRERLGDVCDWIDVVQFAGGHDGRKQCPIFGTNLMTGEERVFSGQAKRNGRALYEGDQRMTDNVPAPPAPIAKLSTPRTRVRLRRINSDYSKP